MYNAVTKYLFGVILFSLISCGNNSTEQAKILLSDANTAVENGNYILAVSLLDSLDAKYPKEVSIRRSAMNLRPKAMEGLIINEIEKNDSILISLQMEKEKISNNFEFVNNSNLVEGYYIPKSDKSNILTKNGIQARIAPNGEFYIISSVIGKKLKHNSISLCVNNEVATTQSVDINNDRNYRNNNVESVTFLSKECDTIGVLAEKYINKKGRIIFIGDKNLTITIEPKELNNLANTHRYATVLTQINKAISNRKLLEEKLQLARDQFARTLQESTNK